MESVFDRLYNAIIKEVGDIKNTKVTYSFNKSHLGKILYLEKINTMAIRDIEYQVFTHLVTDKPNIIYLRVTAEKEHFIEVNLSNIIMECNEINHKLFSVIRWYFNKWDKHNDVISGNIVIKNSGDEYTIQFYTYVEGILEYKINKAKFFIDDRDKVELELILSDEESVLITVQDPS